MDNKTKAIHLPYPQKDAYGALSMPVYHSVAFEFDDAAVMADAFCGRIPMPDYSRVMNPTVMHLEDRVKNIVGAYDVLALNSGMAAISNALIALVQQGKNVVTSRHMFGNTYSFITSTMARWGVEARCVDLTDLSEVERAVDRNTACVFLEIITNPQMEVADVRALSRIAHAAGAPVVADTTAIPFTQFSARELGVDIEVVSSTKYISGGATSLGGYIINYGTEFVEGFHKRLRFEVLFNLGAYMTPQAAYMQTLGLETLDARYRVQSANTAALAAMLRTLPQVKRVNYVGLEDHPYHKIATEQYGHTAGAMFTIDLADKDACYKFINSLKLVKRSTNLFDNRTLAIHPASTIFGPYTPEQRAAMDVLDTTIRLSVGLEDVNDVFADIKQALSADI